MYSNNTPHNTPIIPIKRITDIFCLSPVYFEPQKIAPDEEFRFVDSTYIANIYPQRYLISNYGRLFDLKTNNFIHELYHHGYVRVAVSYFKNPYILDQKMAFVHRFVLIAFNYIEGCEYLEVNHKNGIHNDNRLSNLEWVTAKQNREHAKLNNLLKYGEDISNASFKNTQVLEICELLSNGMSVNDIANKYNVKPSVIYDIKEGRSYKNITSGYVFNNKTYTKRITESQVIEICKMFESGMSINEVINNVDYTSSHVIRKIHCREIHNEIIKKYHWT